ncbi:MAG: hypothetical protein HUN04_24825 [Desulfobacter sp.]|nr:MAG: hypothetical protein HUN04_24825 [Desulfobacter sp.]
MLKTKMTLSSFCAVCLISLVAAMVSGCGGDKDAMKAALAKTGMASDQAACFAEKMIEEGMEAEPYNYMAALMNNGASEKDAVNRTRRKFTAEFKTPMDAARKTCVQ